MSKQAEIHFHPAMLDQLKRDLEKASNQTDAARRLKASGRLEADDPADKLMTAAALDAVLAFLDQLGIDSPPLLRLWNALLDASVGISHPLLKPTPKGKRGRHKLTEGQKEIRIIAVAALELLDRAGFSKDDAKAAVGKCILEAGGELAPTTLRNWSEEITGNLEDKAQLNAMLKSHEPSSVHKLMGVEEADAYRFAANRVMRELALLIRIR